MDYNDQNLTEPPFKNPRLDLAVPNDAADDSWDYLVSFNDELPSELADNAFLGQNGFGDQSQDTVTQNQQPSRLLSPSSAMPVLSSAAEPRSAGTSLPQSPASAASQSFVTSMAGIQSSMAMSLQQQLQPQQMQQQLLQQLLQPQQLQQQQLLQQPQNLHQLQQQLHQQQQLLQQQQQQLLQQQQQQLLQQQQQQLLQQQQQLHQQQEQQLLQQQLQQELQQQPLQQQLPQQQQLQQRQQLPTIDPRSRLIVQQLVLLLHAYKCRRREMTYGFASLLCILPHCQTMKNILMHLSNCRYGRSCTVPLCASSKQILAHWKHCSRADCSICLPLKNSCDRPGAASSANAQTTAFAMHQSVQQQPRTVRPDLVQAYAALGLPPSRQQQAVTNVLRQEPLASSSALPLTTPGVGANHLGMLMSTATMLWSDMGVQQQHRPPVTQQILDLPCNLELNEPGILRGNAFTEEAPNRPIIDWHQSMTQDQRQHLVDRLVKKIYPLPDPALLLDERIMNLVRFLRKVEEEMYKKANSREEYFHLLAEKLNKMRKDLDEKRRKREKQRNNTLPQKMKILRQELDVLRPQSGHCHFEVSRKEIFEESYRHIMKIRPEDLRKRLMVKFRGEEGLDYGGIAREWLYLLSHEMLNPCYGLFQYSRDDIYTLQINPDSGINPEHLSYFHFVGRIIGIAIFHGHHLDGGFTMPFYKQLLGKPITLDDLESVDPDLHRSLVWILNNDITGIIDRGFCVDHEAYGERIVHDLKPGGRDIPVTEENKREYVKLYVNWRFMRGIEAQFLALQKGFSELISLHLMRPFDERELELMISGLGKIDVEDWKKNTWLENCTLDTNIIKWFWQAVEEFDEERRARLLQFVTGSSRVPLQGFKALQGSTGSQGPRLFTIHQVDTDTDSLPEAHTCFNRIDIPPYESYKKFLDKLTCAVEETCGFAIE